MLGMQATSIEFTQRFGVKGLILMRWMIKRRIQLLS